MDSEEVKRLIKDELISYKDQIMALRAILRAYETVFIKQLSIKRVDLMAAITASETALGLTEDQKEIIYTLIKQN